MSDLIYSTAYQPFADRYLHFPHNLMPSSVVLMQVVMNLVYTKSNGQTSVRQTDCIPVVFSSCFFSTRAYEPEPTLFLCFIFTRGIRLRYLKKTNPKLQQISQYSIYHNIREIQKVN